MLGTRHFAEACLVALFAVAVSQAQITPSADAFTNSNEPTKNYGATALLDVHGASEITYIQFNLASIPTTATISQATLKLYVSSVTRAGSFNVDYVNSSWSEGSIDASNAPPVGATITSDVSITTADKNQYILVNITAAVEAWLNGSETNNGIALVANSSFNAAFDSKENTTTSHPSELDIVFAGGDGTITGVTTASGSGLTGGGTSGALNLSLTNACAANQVLQWNGTGWACSNASAGTITGVTAGAGLTGGGASGNVTLGIDTTQVPTLAGSNTFTGVQTIENNLTVWGSVSLPFSGLSATQITGDPDDFGTACDAECAVSAWIESGEGVFSYSYYGPYGLLAASNANGSGDAGIAAVVDWPSTGRLYGVLGTNASGNFGAGIFGVVGDGGESGTGSSWTGVGAGVWGDGSTASNYGVLATADAQTSVFAENNASSFYTLVAYNSNSSGSPFYAYNAAGNGCYVDSSGNINCTGSKNAVVPIDGGQRKVALSAIESPKNWFEDFGSGQLSNGTAVVTIDPAYGETVNTEIDYKVFPVPNGECNGLYVTNKTATSFEVRELHTGTSNVSFDYRIIALRKNYENVRLADHTNDLDAIKTVAKTGTPFHFDRSKMKLPKIPAPKLQRPRLPQPPAAPTPVKPPVTEHRVTVPEPQR
jgi:hypothetical protein